MRGKDQAEKLSRGKKEVALLEKNQAYYFGISLPDFDRPHAPGLHFGIFRVSKSESGQGRLATVPGGNGHPSKRI
jgi:hypothetical protein